MSGRRWIPRGRGLSWWKSSSQPYIALEARLEVVLTGNGPSLLDKVDHRTLAGLLVDDGLLIRVSSSEMCGRTSFTIIAFVQVPVWQFTGYVCKLVGELYDALEAVVKRRLTGSGALRTLVLVQVSPEVSSDGKCVTSAVPVTQGVRCGAVGDSEE